MNALPEAYKTGGKPSFLGALSRRLTHEVNYIFPRLLYDLYDFLFIKKTPGNCFELSRPRSGADTRMRKNRRAAHGWGPIRTSAWLERRFLKSFQPICLSFAYLCYYEV